MCDTITLAEREQLFDDTIHFRQTSRIPTISNIWTWKFLDNGYRLSEGIYNYETTIRSMDEFHERYHFDAYCDLGTRNPMRIADALGGGNHRVMDEQESVAVIHQDHKLMEADEYGELAADPAAFYWHKAFPRICREGITGVDIQHAMDEFLKFGELTATLKENLTQRHHALTLGKAELMLPFDMLFNNLRGIKNLSLDLRKHKEEIVSACDAIYDYEVAPALDDAFSGSHSSFVAPIMIGFLGHSILSVRQFEVFYWPYLQKLLAKAEAYNKPIYFVFEASVERFHEFFQNLPKGRVVIHPEQDDLVLLRNEMPNVALAGGMQTLMLGNASAQECADEAKRLIDTLGQGFILSQDKMISYRHDAKRENLLAVNRTAMEYRG